MLVLEPTDARMATRGLAEWAREGSWWRPWRLPRLGGPLPPRLAATAQMPSGVRIEFDTNADSVEFQIAVDTPPDLAEGGAWVDVFVDGEIGARQNVNGRPVAIRNLGGRRRHVEIWLPHYGRTRVGRIRFRGGNDVTAPTTSPARFITYGSSITQCKAAPYPSTTWPALVARERSWDLCCLGFGGECHLDPLVARYIRDSTADLIHLGIGINIYAQSSFSRRSLAPALDGFIRTIREGHPTAPIVVSSPISSPSRESQLNAVGWTLAEVRHQVAQAVTALCATVGDENLYLIDGLSLLGHDESHLLHDGLHPSAEGYRTLAKRLGPRAIVKTCGSACHAA